MDHSETFLQEAGDLLAQIEEVALALDLEAPAGEAINQLFRAFHTIKGSGAMFGFDAVASFTHHVETVLDQVRDGTLGLSDHLRSLILAARDHIAALLSDEPASDPATLESSGCNIIASLKALRTANRAERSEAGADADTSFPTTDTPPAAPRDPQSFSIRFRPPADLMVAGTNPATLLEELRALGEATVVADVSLIPPLEQLQPDQCHFLWRISLTTTRGINAVRDVFIFVEDGSELAIEEQSVVASAPSAPASPAPLSPPLPASPVLSTASPAPVKSASPPPGDTSSSSSMARSTVRVPSERLDRLVALVGELVMNQSRLARASLRHHDDELSLPVEELDRLVNELRDAVLGIRMMPIGSTFGRFKRLVHDLSNDLGKQIQLVTEGAETELDKTVLDQLGDPLVHLIRNSVDHGIDPPEERARLGKPPCGTIRLAAAHTGSNVVVTIQDDGRGLDTATIRAKAIEKQLISPDAVLGPNEIFNLIFLPGFSTAKQITNVSGRGVGMDVVKRQIEALRGSIHLASEPGRGTTISLTLPLTLAIIEGLLVEVAGDRFILPMASVLETIELPRADRDLRNRRNVVAVRGELVPYLRLREAFEFGDGDLDLEKVVIVRHERERVGLVVDRVHGSHQTVIQSLGRFYRQVRIASGATIMGDGRVALILDLAGLVQGAAAAAA